jgi:hypothetical protein
MSQQQNPYRYQLSVFYRDGQGGADFSRVASYYLSEGFLILGKEDDRRPGNTVEIGIPADLIARFQVVDTREGK